MRIPSLIFAGAALLPLACSGEQSGPSDVNGGLRPFVGGGGDGADSTSNAGAGVSAGLGGAGSSVGGTGAGSGSAGTGEATGETGIGIAGSGDGNAGAATGKAGAAGASAAGAAGNGPLATLEWLPSWATSIQSTETNNLPPALGNNTLRQFVWPTVSGQEVRIQLSNEKGASPVAIQKVHIARALTQGNPANSNGQIDTATDAGFTFAGVPSVTIPAGQTVWSDPLQFNLEEIQLTAISMQFGAAVPTLITGHPGARTTSYVSNGDAVAAQGLANAQTRERWYFINAIEVMAPSDAYAIALLGDSITDGYGVIDQFARWPDFLTLALQNDPQLADTRSVLNFGMGANNLTRSGEFQDAGVVRFGRDVLTRDKIKWLVVLEGVNDIVYSNVQAGEIIGAYQQIIDDAHAAGILVYGGTITPTAQGNTTVRADVNQWIRTSGEFDAVIDFEALLSQPGNVNAFQDRFYNDGLHPNLVGYEAMANAVDLGFFRQLMGD